MSITKDGFYNIEGKMFEVVRGVEGDCLILGDENGGTRISGPKPWGGGQVTKTFFTQEKKYGPIERLEEENAKLRELCEGMLVCYEPCNRSLDARTDCPLYDDGEPLRCRKARLLRELGIEVAE